MSDDGLTAEFARDLLVDPFNLSGNPVEKKGDCMEGARFTFAVEVKDGTVKKMGRLVIVSRQR